MAVPARHSGFTIIEIILVTALVAIASAAVVLSLPPRDAANQDLLETLRVRLTNAQALSLRRAETIGFQISDLGGRFVRLDESYQWAVLVHPLLTELEWPEGVSVALQSPEQFALIAPDYPDPDTDPAPYTPHFYTQPGGVWSSRFALGLHTDTGSHWLRLDDAAELVLDRDG